MTYDEHVIFFSITPERSFVQLELTFSRCSSFPDYPLLWQIYFRFFSAAHKVQGFHVCLQPSNRPTCNRKEKVYKFCCASFFYLINHNKKKMSLHLEYVKRAESVSCERWQNTKYMRWAKKTSPLGSNSASLQNNKTTNNNNKCYIYMLCKYP